MSPNRSQGTEYTHTRNNAGQNTPAILPSSAAELADVLADATEHGRTVTLFGNNSKRLMAGPVTNASTVVSTASLRQVLQYEPNDLTVSVEAGMPFHEIQALLSQHGQMIALDPPYSATSTVGGIVASNTSGPLRRAFGTARDLIIGLTFATLEGKLIKTGGMVVKNVAGLDMGKLMIGSFGTLAAITSVNFRVHAIPEAFATFLYASPDLDTVIAKRDWLLQSMLQPIAIDVLSPEAAAKLNRIGYVVAVRAGGSSAVLKRYTRDLENWETLRNDADRDFWTSVQEFTPDFLKQQSGVVLRVSATIAGLAPLLRSLSAPSIARAASGVTYIYFESWRAIPAFLQAVALNNWTVAVEFAPDEIRQTEQLWYLPPSASGGNAFDMMRKVKQMFDPQNLLNVSRLYGRI